MSPLVARVRKTVRIALDGRGKFTADFAIDHEPYPEEWARGQRGEG